MREPLPHDDGYFHPENEGEVIAIVRAARRRGTPVRVVGSGHSEWAAIQPGLVPPGAAGGGRPPPGVALLLLDRMRGVRFVERTGKLPMVEVEAGCNLGRDPYCTTHESSWKDSLGAQLLARGLALPDLGAISHHTVSGFMSTGSLGGSARHSFFDAVTGVRFVDGRGEVVEKFRGDEEFFGVAAALGLCGVITKVWIEPEPAFNLVGRELRLPISEAPVDFFGDGTGGAKFAEYLRQTDYVRAVWWPQRKFEQVALFDANRVAPVPLFEPVRYELLAPDTRLKSLLAALLLTILGNTGDLGSVREKLGFWLEKLDEELDHDPDDNACRSPRPDRKRTKREVLAALRAGLEASRSSGDEPSAFGRAATRVLGDSLGARAESLWDDQLTSVIVWLVEQAIDGGLGTLGRLGFGKLLDRLVPANIHRIVRLFVEPGDSRFQDCWLCGLAIDDQLDDRLWPLRFMELSVPLDRAEEMMRLLRDYFRAGGDAEEAYARTGPFACQIYPGKASEHWLSPAYGHDVIRFDGFWYGTRAGDPRDHFFRGVWELLAPLGFRPHWGKVLPAPPRRWVEHYERALPRLSSFRALRQRFDPDAVFLTSYFREHLGIT